MFFRKGKGIKINHCGTSDILSYPNIKTKDENGNNLHDTEKNVDLMEVLVNNSSKEGEIVLDPFMGIGSTGIAAVRNGREFIGIEIDNKYYDIAMQRIKKAS
jgi:DNA modification methylase